MRQILIVLLLPLLHACSDFDAERMFVSHAPQFLKVHNPSQEIRGIEELVQREASWWQISSPQAQANVYWLRYKPTRPELEDAFRLLVVKNEKAHFITSGHFNRAHYQAGNA